ncbi:ribosomal RNA small subunit methyltransferase A [Candidatus Peregrinibacteria bacterium]|nr:ribosomal RNA small subunit methyltransferase A [Candidatus Peregrinibacteria bacterium]
MAKLSDKAVVLEILKKHGLYAKKFFGQNFLISENALNKIVETAKIENGDHIIEIGPGLGVLTIELIAKAAKVTSIELDPKIIDVLKENLSLFCQSDQSANIKILHQDALTFSPPSTPYKVVANIPYNITSPLINHFLQAENPPRTLTLLIQKEVAEKIIKKDPDMSVLSLQVALFGQASLGKIVHSTAFFPAPKVDSAILNIEIYPPSDPNHLAKEQALEILKLAKRAFLNGRKKLSNTLPEIKDKLTEIGFADKRPQHLSIDDWKTLISSARFSTGPKDMLKNEAIQEN